MYGPSKTALGRHMPCHNERRSVFEQEESDSGIEDSEKCTDEDEVMPVFLKFSNLHSLNLNNLQRSRRYCSQRHMFFFCIQKTNASVLNIFICCFVCFFVILCHRGWKVKTKKWSTPSFGMLLSKLSNRNTHVCTSSIKIISFFFFLPFCVNCSRVAMFQFQMMPPLCPHGQSKCGQPNVDRPGQGEGGGPKNSQIFADILYGWPYTRMYTNKHVYLCIYTCIHIKREENNKEKRNQRSTSGLSKPLVVSIKLIVWRSIFLIYNLNIQPAFACSNSTP